MMLSVPHQRELRVFTEDFAQRAVPIMARNGEGLLADFVLVELQECMRKVIAVALNNFIRRRNACVKINQLPPEVLIVVASFLPYGSLAAASRVCHYWHTTLRAEASLWKEIVLSFDSCNFWHTPVSEAFQLCKSQPHSLEMRFPYADPQISLVCSATSSVMAHLVHLELWFHYSIDKYLNAMFLPAAPALQTLMIGAQVLGNVQPSRLPDHLFNGDAPHLWSLWLNNVFLSGDPGPALNQVTDFAYFGFKDMPAEELEKVCRLCPRLERFTVLADESCGDYVPPSFVPPVLRTLRLGFWVPPGILHRIVTANEARGDFDLRLYKSSLRALPLVGTPRVKKLHVFFECGTHCNSVSLMRESDDGCIRSEECMPLPEAVDVLMSGLSIAHVTTLSLPDSVLAMLLRASSSLVLGQLDTLTIQFSTTPRIPFPHMFTEPGDPQLCAAPALRTVRLTAWQAYGTPDTSNSVDLDVDFVGRWLPSSTTTLLLSGVQLIGSKERLRCDVVKEAACQSGGNERYLDWDPTWCPEFSAADALCI